MKTLTVDDQIQKCVLFTYTHSQITEGEAAGLLRVDRLEFRDRWIAYLRDNPTIAIETGNDLYLDRSIL